MRQNTDCPINAVLSILSAKWTTEILRELSVGPTRTRRFLSYIPGLTMKCLRQRLQALESMGFVNREELSQRPLKVEYSLTERGEKLAALLAKVKEMADDLMGAECTCSIALSERNAQTIHNCPLRRELSTRSAKIG